MKKIASFYQILLLSFMIAGAVSCRDKDQVTPASASDANQEFQTRLGKKWEVQSISAANARVTAFELPWFEFFSADNKYVVHDGSNVYYGTYSTNATRDTITLNDFGILAVIQLNNTAFDFSLKKNGQTTFQTVFTTVVDATIPSSPATDLLCAKAWTIHWQIPEGEDTIFYNSTSFGITKIEVRFSKNGTYLNHTEAADGFGDLDIVKYWKWNNAAQTEILTSNSTVFDDNNVIIMNTALSAQYWNFSYGTISEGIASR